MSRTLTALAITALTATAAYIAYLRAALAAARHAAGHDPLTGLPNRTTVATRLDAELRAGPVCVLLADLDGFKRVNDRLGHAAGDALLRQVADRLTGIGDRCRLVGRLSGDEFVAIVSGDPPAGLAAAHALHRALTARPYPLGAGRVELFASVGVAASRPGSTAGRLLHEADLAMYKAKSHPDLDIAAHPPTIPDTPVPDRPGLRWRDRRTPDPTHPDRPAHHRP